MQHTHRSFSVWIQSLCTRALYRLIYSKYLNNFVLKTVDLAYKSFELLLFVCLFSRFYFTIFYICLRQCAKAKHKSQANNNNLMNIDVWRTLDLAHTFFTAIQIVVFDLHLLRCFMDWLNSFIDLPAIEIFILTRTMDVNRIIVFIVCTKWAGFIIRMIFDLY